MEHSTERRGQVFVWALCQLLHCGMRGGCLSAGVRGVRVLTVQIMIITRAASVQPVSLSLEKISLEPDIIVMSQAPSSKLSLESM